MRPKIIAGVACRAGSTRLYAKPLQLVGDKPILTHLVDRLRTIPQLDEIILAISNGRENLAFVDYADAHGLRYVRGSELDVLGRLIKAGQLAYADVMLRVTPDCPFICTETACNMLERHLQHGSDLTHMIGLPTGAFGTVVNLLALRKAHQLGGPRYHTAWVTKYMRDYPLLFHIQQLTAEPPLNRPDIRITVDYPEDLIVVRKIYQALHHAPKLITVEEIILFLDKYPKVAAINNWIKPGLARIWD